MGDVAAATAVADWLRPRPLRPGIGCDGAAGPRRRERARVWPGSPCGCSSGPRQEAAGAERAERAGFAALGRGREPRGDPRGPSAAAPQGSRRGPDSAAGAAAVEPICAAELIYRLGLAKWTNTKLLQVLPGEALRRVPRPGQGAAPPRQAVLP